MPPLSPAALPNGSKLTIDVFPDTRTAAAAAASAAGKALQEFIVRYGEARIMVGTGNSQLEMIRCLVRERDIDWSKVTAFHLDEYVGLPASHPASFRRWIRQNFAEIVNPAAVHYIEGDAADLTAMLDNYGQRLLAGPIHLAFVGIGENGHIAFNDPHVADFQDPAVIKRVSLDDACRRQQVGEGHFPDLTGVPREAITVTCTGLFRAERWICCVPEGRKAAAVKGSLEGPFGSHCPGTLICRHPAAALFLDADSASQLGAGYLERGCRVHARSGLASVTR